jgi:hypothetical protein
MNAEAVKTARGIIDSQMGSGLNVFPYLVEIRALVRQDRIDEARASADEYTDTLGEVDWPAIERGAWSQAELDRVRGDLRTVRLIP